MPWYVTVRFVPVLILAALAGCGGEETVSATYPVTGQVLYKSSPVAQGMVFFHPLKFEGEQLPQRPMAVTDENGRFTLMTTQPGDGAPAGEYAITVELRELRADGDEMVRDGRQLLPEKYRSPKTSGLEYTVRAGENEVPLINLK